jgi:hypothetical protein
MRIGSVAILNLWEVWEVWEVWAVWAVWAVDEWFDERYPLFYLLF